jgi:hypothetical protein
MTSTGQGGTPREILLVEDSPGDVRLTREAFRDAKTPINLSVASDGVEAMAFLVTGAVIVFRDVSEAREMALTSMTPWAIQSATGCCSDWRVAPATALLFQTRRTARCSSRG